MEEPQPREYFIHKILKHNWCLQIPIFAISIELLHVRQYQSLGQLSCFKYLFNDSPYWYKISTSIKSFTNNGLVTLG